MKEHPCKYIGIADKVVCRDVAHLESFFQDVIDRGGEGIILRDPKAPLQPGRTTSYLKHKVLLLISFITSPFFVNLRGNATQKFRDGEARIVGKISYQQWECEL